MKIFRYLKKYWLSAILAPLTMVFEVLMDLLQPKLMAVIVDYGINYEVNKEQLEGTGIYTGWLLKYINNTVLWGDMNPQLVIIINTGILMLLLVMFGGLCGVLSGVFTNNAAYKYGNDLRNDVFKHTMNLSFEQTDDFTTGSLVTRMTNDITQVQTMVSMSMRMLIRSLMQFVIGIIMLLGINKKFSLVLLIILPIIIVITILVLRKVGPQFSKMQEAVDDVNAVVQENVTGARVVKAYVKEDFEVERFKRTNQNLYDINWKVFKVLAFISPIMSLFFSGAILAIVYLGGVEIKANFDNGIFNGLKVGEVMSAITFITSILFGFVMLAMMFQTVIRGAASIKRLNAVLDSEPVVNSGKIKEGTSTGEVRFENVGFTYNNKVFKPTMQKKSHYKIDASSKQANVLFLEACRPDQVNREIKIEGKRYGPLSYNIAQTLSSHKLTTDADAFLKQVKASIMKDGHWPNNQNLVTETSY